MSHWNYRVIETPARSDTGVIFGVHEVYYEEDGTIIGYTDAVMPCGDTLEELTADHTMMADAFDKPVLRQADLPPGAWHNPERSE